MAYGEYGEESDPYMWNTGTMDFFQQMAAENMGQQGGQQDYYQGGQFDPLSMLENTFQSSQPNYQQEFEKLLRSGMGPQEAQANLPSFEQQLFGIGMGDLQMATEAERARLDSQQAAINTAMGASEGMSLASQRASETLGKMGESLYGGMMAGAEAGKTAKYAELDNYMASIQEMVDTSTAQGQKLQDYMNRMLEKGDEAALQAQKLGEKHVKETEEWAKKEGRKITKHLSKSAKWIDKQVATAQKAREDFKVSNASAAQAAISGQQALARSQKDMLAMDPNITDAQRASLEHTIDLNARRDLQGFGAQVATQEATLNFTADMEVAKTLGQASAGYQQLAAISTHKTATIGSAMQNAFNSQANLFAAGLGAKTRFATAGLAAGVKGAEIQAHAAQMSMQAQAQAVEFTAQIEDNYQTHIGNAANFYAKTGTQAANITVQGEKLALEGYQYVAQLYDQQQFNYPAGMDLINQIMAMGMSMKQAGMDIGQMRAYSLGDAWSGNAFNMPQYYTVPEWYAGTGGGLMGTASMGGA
jgi:hypothetical protein